MEKNFLNKAMVIYNCSNKFVGATLFIGSKEDAKKFVSDIIEGMTETAGNGPEYSSLQIIDMSTGFYYSDGFDQLLEEGVNKGFFKAFALVDFDYLFDESEQINEGGYYLTDDHAIIESHTFKADELADAFCTM